MKKLILASAVATALACGQTATAKGLKTDKDTASYALGVNIGMSLKQQLASLPVGSIDMNVLAEALTYSLVNTDTSKMAVKPAQTNNIINTYMQRATEMESLKAKAANDAYMANNAKKPGMITTASGLQYEILKEGNGARPAATDRVKAFYTGTLTNGTKFDGTEGQPAEFELNRVIKGWTEGLQLMKVGSKYRFYIPPELGYGNRAMSTIPANSILIFDVELVDVGKASAPAPQKQAPTCKYSFKPYQK